jgi:pre-mRNA cleavage complex 2 protein Pcf11
MSGEDPGAEVAEDFKTALEDMTTTTRVEIMNLCQIARENTEYALEISEALLKHINQVGQAHVFWRGRQIRLSLTEFANLLQTAPHRKLAAFYVLDAIVKNVGTPYTLYVAPKLYATFMESYARVETNVRRKMEEMLKTWKEPVPGSVDKRPVFPPEVITPIENALIKAHTSAMQTLQQQNRNLPPHVIGRPPPGATIRNTPTPPGGRPGSGQNGPQPFAPPNNGPSYPPQQQVCNCTFQAWPGLIHFANFEASHDTDHRMPEHLPVSSFLEARFIRIMARESPQAQLSRPRFRVGQ